VPLIGILAIVAATRLLTAPAGSLLMSQGRPDITLYWNAGASVLSGAIVAGVATIGGIRDVALVLAALYALFFLVHPILLVRSVLPHVGYWQFLHSITMPILLSTAAGLAAAAAGQLAPMDAWLKLVLQCAVGILVYLPAYFVLDNAFVREAAALLLLGTRAADHPASEAAAKVR
jgi:lipopolysaccharide exporter